MSCPTCGHTMHAMGCKVTDRTFFWCPRCGTIKPCDAEAVAPVLVQRCREFERVAVVQLNTAAGQHQQNEWRRLGVAESINRPEGRPK